MSDISVRDRAPSANGKTRTPPRSATRTPPPSAPPANGRDERGRFVKDNIGGPGNPFARQVAMLRAALIANATPEGIQRIATAIELKAQAGDMAAARLYLAYVIGKPVPTVDPDRVDIDEWQLTRQSGAGVQDVTDVLHCMPVDMASNLVQQTLPAIGEGMGRQIKAGIKAMDERDARRAERQRRKEERKQARLARRQQRQAERMSAPSTDGSNGAAAPSTNRANDGDAPSTNSANGQDVSANGCTRSHVPPPEGGTTNNGGDAPSTNPANDAGAPSTNQSNGGGAPSTNPANDAGAPSTNQSNGGGAPSTMTSHN